jgi:hypothetical protein
MQDYQTLYLCPVLCDWLRQQQGISVTESSNETEAFVVDIRRAPNMQEIVEVLRANAEQSVENIFQVSPL